MFTLYYVYVIVIYDGMYIRNMVNMLFKDVFLAIMKSWLTLYPQVVRELGDGYKGSVEENGTYNTLGILWSYSWRGVGILVMEMVLVCGVVKVRMDDLYRLKWESRCLFSYWHLDSVSDFLFSRVFCDGWVIILSFSWRQRRHFFMSYCRWVLVSEFPKYIYTIFHDRIWRFVLPLC